MSIETYYFTVGDTPVALAGGPCVAFVKVLGTEILVGDQNVSAQPGLYIGYPLSPGSEHRCELADGDGLWAVDRVDEPPSPVHVLIYRTP